MKILQVATNSNHIKQETKIQKQQKNQNQTKTKKEEENAYYFQIYHFTLLKDK